MATLWSLVTAGISWVVPDRSPPKKHRTNRETINVEDDDDEKMGDDTPKPKSAKKVTISISPPPRTNHSQSPPPSASVPRVPPRHVPPSKQKDSPLFREDNHSAQSTPSQRRPSDVIDQRHSGQKKKRPLAGQHAQEMSEAQHDQERRELANLQATLPSLSHADANTFAMYMQQAPLPSSQPNVTFLSKRIFITTR